MLKIMPVSAKTAGDVYFNPLVLEGIRGLQTHVMCGYSGMWKDIILEKVSLHFFRCCTKSSDSRQKANRSTSAISVSIFKMRWIIIRISQIIPQGHNLLSWPNHLLLGCERSDASKYCISNLHVHFVDLHKSHFVRKTNNSSCLLEWKKSDTEGGGVNGVLIRPFQN